MAVREPEKTKDTRTPKSLASQRATWQTKLRLEKGKIRQALTARLNTRLRGRFKGVPRSAQRAVLDPETGGNSLSGHRLPCPPVWVPSLRFYKQLNQ